MLTTIDRAGRLVIPKEIRERAGLKPGLKLEVEYRDGRVEIEPVRKRMRFVRKGSFLVASAPGAPPLTHEMVNELIEEDRERRKKWF